ncbi:MAG: class I SAM-dependent methyltransferase [Gemmatimonadota bacterium]|nr:class I SAM-dependent methyltransferase [Gemmatimonadota bacterium]
MRRSWDANADAWTEAVRKGYIPSRRAGTEDAIVDAVTAHPPGRALDVGCGEGWLARVLSARGWDVLGTDGSEPLIRQARDRGEGRFLTLGYEEMMRDPATIQGPWDAVVCNFSLLGPELEPLLRTLAGTLAPGGRLLIQTAHPWTAYADTPYEDGWCTETFEDFGVPFAEPMPWFFRTLGSWVAAIGRSGLDLVEFRVPVHPDTGQPLSLILVAGRPGEHAPEWEQD